MHFANVDGQRLPAEPGLSGECPSCRKPMVARCGTRRVWHWAHKGVRCDDWWEPETGWHRAWKDEFPADWQEVIHRSDTGERHIADVRTPHGLVIEFQHSRLPPEERSARENFYGNMVWVVDATRLDRDVTRFLEFKDYFHPTHLGGIAVCNFSRCFPADWSWSSVLVVFDFAQEQGASDAELWCLLPGRVDRGRMLVAPLPRDEFVRMAREQSFIFESEGIMAEMAEHYRKEEALWFGRR